MLRIRFLGGQVESSQPSLQLTNSGQAAVG